MNPEPKISADDNEVDPDEIFEVVNDTETVFIAPEEAEETRNLKEWDTPPDAQGHAAHKVLPEDEIPVGETLIYDGMEVADTEQRVAAVDPDFEP